MLGELIYEGRGKRTGRTVLPLEGTAPRIEVSFEETGKLVGIEANFIGTYWLPSGPMVVCMARDKE